MYEYNYSYEVNETKTYSIAKVFGYMFLALMITASVSFGLYYLLLNNALNPNMYLVMMVISSISVMVLSIYCQIALTRGKIKGGFISYVLFSIMMGVLLSSIFILYDMSTIGYAFICTGGSFGIMALYGYFTKKQTATLGMFGIGFLFGVVCLSLINFFLRSDLIFWIITYVGLAIMLGITAWDINRTKKLADNGMLSGNIAIYMALDLYTDFIYIFIRILAIVGRNKK